MNKIFLTGHNGMVGSAIKRNLKLNSGDSLIIAEKSKLNLERQNDVEEFFKIHKPDVVIVCAAKVGGINANNTFRADFIYNNLQIQNNLIHSSHLFGVKKLLFLGSSCIYPKYCQQPIKENELLTGKLEYTNEPYAVAKIAGIKMCESYYKQYGSNFISVMPTNLYGINDNFDLNNSHVVPALIRKFHEAKIKNEKFVKLWGTGKALREFMFVDDMAKACIEILKKLDAKNIYDDYKISHINIGTGKDISIKDLAEKILSIVEFDGKILFDENSLDGTPRKLLDVSILKSLGFNDFTNLDDGLKYTYDWYKNCKNLRQ